MSNDNRLYSELCAKLDRLKRQISIPGNSVTNFEIEDTERQVNELRRSMEAKDAGFDSVAFIMAFEEGELEHDEIVEGFQHLVDSGMAWQLQGSYGRAAQRLIDAGLVEVKA